MRDYLQKVLELTRPYRGRFALGLFAGFLSGMLAFTLPVSLKLAIDTVFPHQSVMVAPGAAETNAPAAVTLGAPGAASGLASTNAAAATASPSGFTPPAPLKKLLDGLVGWFRPPGKPSVTRLAMVIALIPAAMLIRNVLTYMNIYLLSWVGIRAANDLRVRLFRHLMHMPLGFFSKSSTGDLMTRLDSTLAVNNTITSSFSVIIREPISVVVLIITLITLQPLLSLFTLLVFPICLVPVVIFGRKFRKSEGAVHSRFANLSKVMHESFTGIRVIKGYNLENMVVNEFRAATEGVTNFFMRSLRAGELPGPLIEFIGSLGVALVLAYFAFFSGGRAPVGDLMYFFMAVFSLYAPVKNISRLNHQLTLARAGVMPAYEVLAIESSLPEPAQPKPLQAHDQPIRFENVSFSYGDKTVLQDINLTIQPGQLVALVGRTGSGKTSIANLLLRFYDPQKGGVRIGDTDIREVASRDLRANVAVVTQQTILFNDTIRHNIALGRPGATDAEIEEASKHAYAHNFIMEKPQGYETPVGEKGVNLSGGQQQRIAIARAVLKNAPILILDEATSALDTESERIVQTALEALMKGRTTICIAHRLSTIQNADVIVVLDGGKIVEMGNHEELMKSGGLYSKFYELQFDSAMP
jgi:ATP-binding cassette, subfamily B, bacterial MsbA